MFGAAFYGDQGTLVIDGSSYRMFDAQDKETGRFPGSGSDAPHLQNFLDCIRSGARPAADIEEGHKSTFLCHAANIALRTGQTLALDADTHLAVGNDAARAIWGRDYRPGWEPKV